MASIRERIEAKVLRQGKWSDPDLDRMRLLHEAWVAGTLIPADEVDARMAEAVRVERERCAEIAEDEGRRSISCSGAYIAQRIREERP